MYRKPPAHGMILVSRILSDPKLRLLWESEMKVMTNRIMRMRACLRRNLEKLGSHINWEHITNQVGMFCYSGLSIDQIVYIAKKFHVYITHDGRISMAGVTEENVEYLAEAIHEATRVNK
ncbi:aspartate aminotransferase, mitochondrial-like [Impatiens glandulifera]|uniref:aspartate aminotransferase, mitochondrial-like n=1 Tax=Impatiens glandulifera TaxID=253017 RepID=UPI001FB1808E|nr:aspartate aminotransferase, mitochondrial-like [Impatiens glandulifera]